VSGLHVDPAAARLAGAALERHAAALAGLALPDDGARWRDCPLAGPAHHPYQAARSAAQSLLGALAGSLAATAADLAGAAGRTERADADAAASFDRIRA
jgi:hypothetical protein